MIRTKHPKLLILETHKELQLFKTRNNLFKIWIHLHTSIRYLYMHIKRVIWNEVNKLYYGVLTQKCKVDQQVWKNTLILATLAPDEFAYPLMKGSGHMSIISGKVVHLIKCTSIEVRYRKMKECYLNLSIDRGNQTSCFKSKTDILRNKGTQTNCNPFV